jgi:uncharacterized protein YpmB
MIRRKKFYQRTLIKPTVLVLVVILALVAGVYWQRKRQESPARQQMKQIVAEVGKLIILPTGEEPTLVTVEDKTKVSDTFLKQSENGDKILLYPIARKVFLYRPSSKKLVDVGPLNIDPSVAEIDGTRIAVMVGNNNEKHAKKLSETLVSQYSKAEVQPVTEASRQDFPYTIVIDFTDGKKYNLVNNMISELGAKRGVLPTSETKPNADILVITGLDAVSN